MLRRCGLNHVLEAILGVPGIYRRLGYTKFSLQYGVYAFLEFTGGSVIRARPMQHVEMKIPAILLISPYVRALCSTAYLAYSGLFLISDFGTWGRGFPPPYKI